MEKKKLELVQPLWEQHTSSSKKLKIKLPHGLAVLLVSIYQKEMRSAYKSNTCCMPIFIVARDMELTQEPFIWMDKKNSLPHPRSKLKDLSPSLAPGKKTSHMPMTPALGDGGTDHWMNSRYRECWRIVGIPSIIIWPLHMFTCTCMDHAYTQTHITTYYTHTPKENTIYRIYSYG